MPLKQCTKHKLWICLCVGAVEQLIKGTANNCRLDIKITGHKKKTYVFEDVRQRENFCQLVQQLKNMHSLDPEVKHVSIFIGTWNMGLIVDSDSLLSFLGLLLYCQKIACHAECNQGDHKPGKPGVLGDFYEHGKLMEFCATLRTIFVTNKIVSI